MTVIKPDPYATHGAGIFTHITGWFWTRANVNHVFNHQKNYCSPNCSPLLTTINHYYIEVFGDIATPGRPGKPVVDLCFPTVAAQCARKYHRLQCRLGAGAGACWEGRADALGFWHGFECWFTRPGKRLHNYGKSPFLMEKLTISMVIFNSYVKLPEGNGDFSWVLWCCFSYTRNFDS